MYFSFSGNRAALEIEASKFIEGKDVSKFVDGLVSLSPYISDNENITATIRMPEINPDVMELLIPETNYNINLKVATILIIAALFDVNITKGIASYFLGAFGFSNRAIVKLNEKEGEKCIVLEMLRAKSRTVDQFVLPPINGECFNNHLDCKYRTDGLCKIKRTDVIRTLDNLCDKNIIQKVGEKYRYNV